VSEAYFVGRMEAEADRASAATGVLRSVILAQWGLETAWGSSPAWLNQCNPAGIGWNGHTYTSFATIAAGIDGWIQTMRLACYAAVRAATTRNTQAVALGLSPWAGGHYIAPPGGPGSALLDVIALYGLARFDPAPPPPPPLEEVPLYAGPFVAHDDARQFIIWPNGTKTALGTAQDGTTLTTNPVTFEWPYVPLSPAALDAIPGQ
jgi:hypothetical protein